MAEEHIIKRLGGSGEVGRNLRDRGIKVEDVTVRSWTLPGRTIPAKYWVHIAALADDRGVPMSFEQLARQAAA
jgi:hypothetical protein